MTIALARAMFGLEERTMRSTQIAKARQNKRLSGRCAMALLTGGLLAALAKPATAQQVPNIAGPWMWENDTRRIVITQKGAEVSGKALRQDGTLAFELSGSVDAAGMATLKVFYDRSDMAAGTPPKAFDEAVKLIGDKAHPERLPAKSTVDLKYDAGKDQLVGHMLKVDVKIHHNTADDTNHDKDYVELDKESPVEATLTRIKPSLIRIVADKDPFPTAELLEVGDGFRAELAYFTDPVVDTVPVLLHTTSGGDLETVATRLKPTADSAPFFLYRTGPIRVTPPP